MKHWWFEETIHDIADSFVGRVSKLLPFPSFKSQSDS